MSQAPKASAGHLPKQERAFQLARTRYELRRTDRWPYLLSGDQRYGSGRSDRKRVQADLRAAWRAKYPDDPPPADTALNSVIDDLLHLARDVEPDAEQEPPAAVPGEAWAGGAGAYHGGDDDEGDGLELVTSLDDCPLPDSYRMPSNYRVRADGGIWWLGGRWGPERASWAPLFPVGVYEDPDGDQLVELVWRDHGRWVSRLVRRAVTKSGRKLVGDAGDAALPVTESEARNAEKWIAAAEMANADLIPRHPVARQLGWQNDGRTFLASKDSSWRVEPRYPRQVPALNAHGPRGTFAGWQAAIQAAGNYPVVQMGIYEGLAPPLLEVLGVDSFTVDHAGKSSRGKTITAAAGLSCWADPSDKGDGMFSWSTTVIEIEQRLNLVRGLPVVIDETRLVKDPAIVDAILYQVPKNRGKARGGGHPSMIPWRTIVLCTGEQPATSFTTHQGASARVLSIQRAPFGTEGAESRDAAEALKHGIEANYGTAGPAFVEQLQSALAERDGAARLRERHAQLTEELRGDSDMSGRRAPLLAVIALAAELAAGWGITPFTVPGTAGWLDLFNSADDPRDNRAEMALDIVREFLAAHHDKMFGGHPGDRPPASGWIGRYVEEGPGILPAALGKELKEQGYDLNAVVPGWLEMKALVTMKGQRPPWQVNRKLNGCQTKLVIFRSEVIDWEDGGDGD